MKEFKIIKYFFSTSLSCCMLFLFSFSVLAQEKTLTVISNSKGAPDQMSLAELTAVLKGEKQRWSNTVPVVIALMKSSTETGLSTSKKIYHMTSNEFNKYWLALVFQGKAKAPVFFNSPAELESFVAETPGAIGVIESSTSGKVRQVIVEGKKSF
jgi:hypothetical protein